MALSLEQLAEIRAEIGSTEPPTDSELFDAFERVGTTKDVVLQVLNVRLANMLAGPSSVTIPGIYSESNGDSIRELKKQIASVDMGGRSLTSSRLVRAGRRRR